MELIKSILMGLMQGILEFMPVSSSGHLILVEHIFNSANSFEILFITMLHITSILAIIITFPKDMANLVTAACGIAIDIISNAGLFIMRLLGIKTKGYYIINSSPQRKFFITLTQTCAVAGITGLGMRAVFYDVSESMIGIGISFIISGIALQFADRLPQGYKKIKNSNVFDAVIIGAVQGFSVIPGLSRMGLSVLTAMALGMEKTFAIKYSIISSIPMIFGAFILELSGAAGMSLSVDYVADCFIGMLVALITSIISIKIILGIMKNHNMTGFAVYGCIIGIFSIIMGFIK